MAVNHENAENWLFHVAQLFILGGYFFGVATVVNGIHRFWGMPYYRSILAFGNFWLVIWAAVQAKALDHMIWNIGFFCFNFFHFVYLMLFEKRIVLNDYLNNLWFQMFNEKHYNLELLDYYNLMQEKAFLKTYHEGQYYIQEADVPTQLSILLAGKMRITKRDDFQRRGVTMAHESLASDLRIESQTPEDNDVGVVYPYEFIDSYEWLSVQGDSQVPGVGSPREVTSQVSIKCEDEDCVVLTWKNSTLDAVFKEYPRLKVCISALVGKDIAEKMLRITGHAVDDIAPDVDMVRKTKSCFTKRAEVLNAKLTPEMRKVDPSMTHRATQVYDQTATKIYKDGDSETRVEWQALTKEQQYIRSVLGSGPWCDLRDEELRKPPWRTTVGFEEQTIADASGSTVVEHKRVEGVPWRPEDFNHHLLQKEMHSLQRARLRVANARLLAINPAPLESLHPKSDSSEENQVHGAKLMQYFEDVLPELPKKDLHEVLKWGKWRSYYRPGTVLQRQGEEAHYIGIVIQGRLAYYTEDEITRNKTLVHFVDRFQLVGSEDFTSKYRTARRTIAMPDLVNTPKDGEDPPQRLPVTVGDSKASLLDSERNMYEMTSIKSAEDWKDRQQRSQEEKLDMEERIKEAKRKQQSDGTGADDNEKVVLLTRIPTVLFCWDHNDLKRLVLADPHVESCISTLLRGDITYKLDNASEGALPTRVCGVPGPARGDHDVRLCNAGA